MKLAAKIGFVFLLCCAFAACGGDDEYDPMLQRDNFRDFLDGNAIEYDSNLAADYIFKVVAPDSIRIEPMEPQGEPLRAGDQISINYIGYLFNSSSSSDKQFGRGGVFTTNMEIVAEAIGLDIPEHSDFYTPLIITLGDKKLLSGLNKGIPGSRVGDAILLYLTADDVHGGGNPVGSMDPNLPVIYEIYIKEKIN